MLSTIHGDTWDLVVVYYEPTAMGGAGFDEPAQPDLEHPVDLTGYTALLQVRDRPGAPIALELTTEPDGGLTLDGPAGLIAIRATPAQMSAVAPGRWRVELQIENEAGSDRRTILSDVLSVEHQIAVAAS